MITGFEKPQRQPQGATTAVLGLIPHLNEARQFVKVVWKSPVTDELLQQLTRAERDPYEIIGLRKS